MADGSVRRVRVRGDIFYVYVLYRPDGTPCYVGKGHGYRARSHFNKTHNKHLERIIKLAGGTLLLRKIVEDMPESEAYELEAFLISVIGRRDDGGHLVNQSAGGEWGGSGRIMSAEEKAMRCKALANEATRERMRLSHLGKPSARKGQKATPETIERLRISHTGKKQPADVVEKRAAKVRGNKHPPESVERRAAQQRGVPKSPEVRAKMKEGRKGMKLSDSHKANIGLATAAHFENDEYRNRHSERMKRWWAYRKSNRE
jgi:hypothetical protein